MIYTFETAPKGTYVNIFSLINGGFEVNDNLGNDYISLDDKLDNYKQY